MMIRDELREILRPMFTEGERHVLNAAVSNRIHNPDAFIVNENSIGPELQRKLNRCMRRAQEVMQFSEASQ
jgi:RNA processing factor Prp31